MQIKKAIAMIGTAARNRLTPQAFMAMISLFREKDPKVIKEAKRTPAGIISQIIMGIPKKKKEIIC